MTQISLQHLRRIDPREVWASEPSDFTPWLAEADNFSELADTLHLLDAEVEGTEQSIGSFSADIVAKDRDGYVLVENQLDQTDHTHLGQILTYLAGLDGPTKVVWIAKRIREEHRAAIDWLNAHTSNQFSFFAVELELLRIGESPAAPLFSVVAKPNDWSRHISGRARQISETPNNDRQKQYLEFWTAFREHLQKIEPDFTRAPAKEQWWGLPIGRTGFGITLTAVRRDRWLGAELYIQNDPESAILDALRKDQEAIEADFGEILEWEPLEDKKGSRVAFRWRDVDPMDQTRWSEFHDWHAKQLERFRRCFAERVKSLDLDAIHEGSHREDSRAADEG